MSAGLISENMLSIVGKPYQRMRSFPISASDIRRWAMATYFPEEPPRHYWDEEVAADTPAGSLVAPRDFNPFAWIIQDPPGPQRGQPPSYDDLIEGQFGIAGPGLSQMLNGGIEIEYGARMRPGDVIDSVSRVNRYDQKGGSRGPLLLTFLEVVWTNQDGTMVRNAMRTTVRY